MVRAWCVCYVLMWCWLPAEARYASVTHFRTTARITGCDVRITEEIGFYFSLDAEDEPYESLSRTIDLTGVDAFTFGSVTDTSSATFKAITPSEKQLSEGSFRVDWFLPSAVTTTTTKQYRIAYALQGLVVESKDGREEMSRRFFAHTALLLSMEQVAEGRLTVVLDSVPPSDTLAATPEALRIEGDTVVFPVLLSIPPDGQTYTVSFPKSGTQCKMGYLPAPPPPPPVTDGSSSRVDDGVLSGIITLVVLACCAGTIVTFTKLSKARQEPKNPKGDRLADSMVREAPRVLTAQELAASTQQPGDYVFDIQSSDHTYSEIEEEERGATSV